MNSPLVDIGAELRQARESQQRSLDELSHLTLIHNRHLQAVEDGRDADLPEPFYVKNFIRKYANALGLPGDAMANRYWDTRPLPAQPPKPASTTDIMVPWWVFPAMLGALLLGAIATFAVMNNRAPAVAQSPGVETSAGQAATAGASDSVFAGTAGTDGAQAASGSPGATDSAGEGAGSAGPALAGATGSAPAGTSGSALVGASGSALADNPESAPGGTQESDGTNAEIASVPSPPVPSPQPTSTPTPLNMPPLVVPGREISFKTFNREDAWMQIVADGREVHSGVMPKNMVRTWVAHRSLSVRIGRPGVVSARLGDRSLGSLGPKDAAVYRRTFYTQAGYAQQEEAAGDQTEARPGNQPEAPAANRRAASPKPKPTARSAARPTHAPPTPAPDDTPGISTPVEPEGATRTITVE